MTRVIGYYESDISDDDLVAAAEWYDNVIAQERRMQDMTPTIADLHTFEVACKQVVLDKDYHGLHFSLEYQPNNDEVRMQFYYYNSEWSSTHIPQEMKMCGRHELNARLADIKAWLITQPHEAEAREHALLRDYAKIKERIAASRLPDIVKAEAEALMKKMTTNILPPPAV